MSRSMKSWQAKAIKNGRQPLPERPGQRPWLPIEPERSSSPPPEASLAEKPVQKLAANGAKGSAWTDEEVDLLSDLKRRNLSWLEIQRYFPKRPMDGIKQKWFKRVQLARQAIKAEAERNKAKTPAEEDDYPEK
ncbi:hypothetical protein G7Z17_g8098 [Cylindrodendrum hubeiense]|uniref:Myb-like domain-containing protein n=1 Tax=Cylindrodendrum hubeiense TaxID=595255 RepID=A0A9P5LEP2_9HYPO|nr:hypothetical protein G7Z17_g8098 [Cylindrodendrum hubeiense]